MKVLGLKDFDQHISPLSLTFHWTRVSGCLFLYSFISQVHVLSLSFLLTCKHIRKTVTHPLYLQMHFWAFHSEIFPSIMISVLFSD